MTSEEVASARELAQQTVDSDALHRHFHFPSNFRTQNGTRCFGCQRIELARALLAVTEPVEITASTMHTGLYACPAGHGTTPRIRSEDTYCLDCGRRIEWKREIR